MLIIAILMISALAAVAQERSSLLPEIPKASGAPHPEGNEFWRMKHMDLMLHDRDLTVRDGNRQIAASLKQCFDCHTTTDTGGNVVTYKSEKHFCRVCHDYVAVKVDCFMCHRSTPDGVDEKALNAAVLPMARPKADINRLAAYLESIRRATGLGALAATAQVSP